MDGSSDDGDDDPFEYDPFERADGPDDGPDEDRPEGTATDPGRGSDAVVSDPQGGPGTPDEASTHGDDGPGGTLGVDWGPRRGEVTLLDRFWAVGTAIGLGIAGFVVAFFVFQAAFVALLLAGIEELSFVGNLIVGFLVLQGISFPLVALGYLRARDLPLSYLKARVPDLWDAVGIVAGFLLVVALVVTVIVAITAVDAPQAERTDTEGFQENPDAILLMIPASILLIGPAEELLFRGVIQTRLRESFGPVGAIVFANFAFAPLHVFALSGSATAVAITIGALFVPGLVFGTAYELTDNLTVPALIHGLYNALIFTSFYVSATTSSSGFLVAI